MPGVRTLAEGKRGLWCMPTKPANKNAITDAEATAAVPWSKDILASDFDLGATGSDTIAEKDLTVKGNAQVFGSSNFGGGFTAFRYTDPDTGDFDEDDDTVWEAAYEKGTILYLLVRESGKDATEPLAAGDPYEYYEVITDDPVRGDRTGFIKWRHNVGVQDSALHKKIVAAGGGGGG